MRPRFALMVLCSLALVVAGCGSAAGGGGGGSSTGPGTVPGGGGASAAAAAGGGAGGGGGAHDLCSLLTQDEVNAAAGGALATGAPQNDGQMCLWQDANNGEVSISVGGTAFSDICTADTPKVSGIGDSACYLGGTKLATLLDFLKGGERWEISVIQPKGNVATIETAEKTLALAAIARM